jgi:hypothetical protein
MNKIGIGVCALFWALPASAQEWSKEELAAGMRTLEMTRYAPAGSLMWTVE